MKRKVYTTAWLGTDDDETPFDIAAILTTPFKVLDYNEPPDYPEIEVWEIVNQWTGAKVRYGDLADDDRHKVDDAVMEAAQWED